MRRPLIASAALCLVAAQALAQDKPRSTLAQSLTPPALSQQRVDSGLIEFPLPFYPRFRQDH